MKTLIFGAALAVVFSGAFAQDVTVERRSLGSGVPGTTGVQNAEKWDNDIRHAPQYLPGYPTAAVIFPRVVTVECKKAANGKLDCAGFNWTPDMGRAEYLLVQPRIVEAPKPVIVERVVEKSIPVIVEVPIKKIGE